MHQATLKPTEPASLDERYLAIVSCAVNRFLDLCKETKYRRLFESGAGCVAKFPTALSKRFPEVMNHTAAPHLRLETG